MINVLDELLSTYLELATKTFFDHLFEGTTRNTNIEELFFIDRTNKYICWNFFKFDKYNCYKTNTNIPNYLMKILFEN